MQLLSRTGLPLFAPIVVLATLLLTGLSLGADWLAQRTEQWVGHSHKVIGESHALMEAMVEAETAHRGFLITHDPAFLQPWRDADRTAPRHLARLRELTADNPRQAARVERMAAIVATKFGHIRDTLDRMAAGEKFNPATRVSTVHLADFSALIDEFEHSEGDLLAQRRITMHRMFWLTVGSDIVIGIAALAALLAAGRAMRTNLARLDLAEKRALEAEREATRAANRRAETSDARYRSIVDTAVDGMVVIDANGVICSFNKAAETLFGYGADEAIGRNVAMLMPEPDHSAHDVYLDNYRRTGIPRIIGIGREVVGRRKDGSHFPLELSIAEWRDGGQRYFTGIVRDITRRKQTERDLLSARNLAEQASRAKSKFLAAASHDLRQPVQAMMLLSSALASQLAGHPASDIADSINGALDAFQLLLNGLLDISRLDAGVVVAAPEPAAVGTLVARLANSYRPQAEAKGLTLRVGGGDASAHTDPLLLERILRNLIENAIRYTETGGIVIGCRRHGAAVRLQVVDSGIGIPADQQRAVFEEFYQLGNTERDRSKGLGLGLSIVRRLAAILGHPLSLRSRPGHGSSFTLDLPACPAQPHSAAPPKPANEAGYPGLVLVIDDELIIRQSLHAVLSGWGCQVATAADSEEAVSWVRANRPPDLIIADYRLRGGRIGTNAVKEVHLACGHPVPAIILTGDTSPERMAEVHRSGFEIAHKPLSPDKLRAMVNARRG